MLRLEQCLVAAEWTLEMQANLHQICYRNVCILFSVSIAILSTTQLFSCGVGQFIKIKNYY